VSPEPVPPQRLGVVVPAHNEETRLGILLESLRLQADVHLDVVVVPNGCSDRTADVARSMSAAFVDSGHRFKVLELALGSKCAAMNAADHMLDFFPRVYLDADVILAPGSLAALAAALDVEAPRIAGPRITFATTGLARHVAAALLALPPFSDDVVGGGLYGVNTAGRARWANFPAIMADDAFVLGRFQSCERVLATDAQIVARFPRTGRLLSVLARWEVGHRQLRALGLPVPTSSGGRALRTLVQQPHLWVGGLSLMAFKVIAKLLALDARRMGNWARAEP
jgi:glycosyltransferase involved in cell wall biosynthesis